MILGEDGSLMGLMSFQLYDYEYTGAIRVSLYNDWINETTSSVPEPATLVMFATGSLALLPRLLRRRKRQAG